jgi:hypothetical protein
LPLSPGRASQAYLHFTPTFSSWLNQVELWFARIERDVVARGVFTSVNDLARKLMRYIRHHNQHAAPIKWSYRDLSHRIITTFDSAVQASSLSYWDQQWGPQPPHPHIELVNLQDADIDVLIAAYEALLGVHGLGPTAAAKILFALHPETAMPWDEAIRAVLNIGANGRGYRDMLVRSKHEAALLIADAIQCGIGDRQDIPGIVGSPDRTLARLLDQYNWITITNAHQIPRYD